jgi:hypothetical protein
MSPSIGRQLCTGSGPRSFPQRTFGPSPDTGVTNAVVDRNGRSRPAGSQLSMGTRRVVSFCSANGIVMVTMPLS